METIWRPVVVTAIAPIAWGSTYWVTREFLPPDAPLWGSVFRALPAGLLLFALRPRRPRGAWWWRAGVLGALNVGVFFALIYLVAQLLPTSIATTIMATSPAAMMVLARLFAGERLRLVPLLGAGLGIAGVALLLAGGGGRAAPLGIGASVLAMLLSSLGYILAKRWRGGTDILSITSWQLLAGGLLLLPTAFVVEGAPPMPDGPGLAAFAYVSVIATAVAFAAWFAGLARLPAGTVGLVGLLNPVAGVLLGVLVAGERLEGWQLVGLAVVLLGIVLGQPALQRSLARFGESMPLVWWPRRHASTSEAESHPDVPSSARISWAARASRP
ncbi:DMT family transporter [Agromyces sp. M3QZ16-3]|uniref:DMT family transporter n=1 Tax=Agromyces sp. M3QZ16-3 TaxID=3447585 RepID=UPI003F68CE3A